jgi:hypothetical protein
MRPKLRVPLLVLAAALLALPASAVAGTKSASGVMSVDEGVVTLTPKCTDGQRATGGGWRVSEPPFSPSSAIRVFESRKIGQRSWRVSATVNLVGTVKTLTALTYCAKAPKTKQKQRTAVFTGSPGLFVAADAKCGGGTAQAGGFLATPGRSTEILESFRQDRKTWRSRAEAVGGGAAAVTSYAYCAEAKKPVARSGFASPILDAPETATSADCKRGTKPAAGGFSQTGTTPASRYLYAFENLRIGKHWLTSASHPASPGAARLNAIAYCA